MELKFGWLKHQLVVLAIAILIIISLVPTSVNAQESRVRVLSVTGTGQEMIPTTLTQVQLGVEVQGETSSAVQQEVAKKSTSVVNFLRSRNVDKLQTTGISLQPNYNYNSDKRELIGYIGANNVSFRLETDKIGDLLDKVVTAGATRIDQISFTSTDSAINTAQQKALQTAVQDAQSQAEAVLSTLNYNSQDIISIQLNGASMPQPMPNFEAAALAKDAQSSTPVIGGEQNVSASVTLQISY